jgi:hypothetical protein
MAASVLLSGQVSVSVPLKKAGACLIELSIRRSQVEVFFAGG